MSLMAKGIKPRAVSEKRSGGTMEREGCDRRGETAEK